MDDPPTDTHRHTDTRRHTHTHTHTHHTSTHLNTQTAKQSRRPRRAHPSGRSYRTCVELLSSPSPTSSGTPGFSARQPSCLSFLVVFLLFCLALLCLRLLC